MPEKADMTKSIQNHFIEITQTLVFAIQLSISIIVFGAS